MDSQNLQELMRVEDRKRRLREWPTPQERMAKYFQFRALAKKVLESNPVARAEFHRRILFSLPKEVGRPGKAVLREGISTA